MFSFFRRKSKLLPAPQWTNFSSLFEFEKFIGIVDRYFRAKGLAYTRNEDLILVRNEAWKYGQMGLWNLAQICKLAAPSQWKEIIWAHFDGLQRALDFETEFYRHAHDFSYAVPYIGVRVYPKEYIGHAGEGATIKQPISDDLVALLVFDFPHAICNIKPETTIQWNKTNEEIYDIGLANMRHKYSWQINSQLIDGVRIWFIEGEDLFVANSVLVLHLLSIPESRHGALIAIPNRHTVLVCPIQDLAVVKVLQPFIAILSGLYKDGPGSISEKLYWYKDKQLEILPYDIEKDVLNFKPSEGFLDMLHGLDEVR
jgi:hypothetical protein